MRQARIGVVGLLLGALLVGVLGRSSPTAAASAASVTTYRIVGATHTSSSQKNDPPFYAGSSSSSWRLAPPTRKAPNRIAVTVSGPLVTGLGTVNVRGVYKAEATTNSPARCSLTASTGTTRYPATAPGPFQLAVGPDPRSPSRVLVAQGAGLNVHASLSNPYFGTECSTSVSGEPSNDQMMTRSLPKTAFRQKVVVVRYVGASNRDGIVYRWSTTFTLKRIKPP